jgi:hypothetical protein
MVSAVNFRVLRMAARFVPRNIGYHHMSENAAAPNGGAEAEKPPASGPSPGADPSATGLLGLAIGSIGVVYGDIGTSPLYAFHEAIKATGAEQAATSEAVFGVLSLILWALIFAPTTTAKGERSPSWRSPARRPKTPFPPW